MLCFFPVRSLHRIPAAKPPMTLHSNHGETPGSKYQFLPLRFLLIELHVHFSLHSQTLVQTQRTQRHSQSSPRRCREILSLRGLCGLHFASFAGFALRSLRFLPNQAASSLWHFSRWFKREERKHFRKVREDATARFFLVASPTAFPSRPSRASLRELCVFCQSKTHLLVFSLSALVLTQRTQSYSQSSQRRCREILSLCVLCGPRFAAFAFSADRTHVLSLHSLNAKTAQFSCQTSTNHKKNIRPYQPFEPQNARIV